MRYEYIKIVIFWSLIAALPGIIFLIQIVIIMPANMMLANALLGFTDKPFDWGMIIIFGGYFLITIGMWAVLSIVLAKLICFLKRPATRNMMLILIMVSLLSLTFQPIYGGGGHSLTKGYVTAAGMDGGGLLDYWTHVFPPTILFALCSLWYRSRKIKKNG
jgi:hypothetical protein